MFGKAVQISAKLRVRGIKAANYANEQRIGRGAFQNPQIVFDPGTGFDHDGAGDASAGNLRAIGVRQGELRRLPLWPRPGHALGTARFQQMNMGIDDRDGAWCKNGRRCGNRRGEKSRHARQKMPPLHFYSPTVGHAGKSASRNLPRQAPVKDINSRKHRGTPGESSGKKKPAFSGDFLFHVRSDLALEIFETGFHHAQWRGIVGFLDLQIGT